MTLLLPYSPDFSGKISLDNSSHQCYAFSHSNVFGKYFNRFYSNRLSRKRLDFINRFSLYPECLCAQGEST